MLGAVKFLFLFVLVVVVTTESDEFKPVIFYWVSFNSPKETSLIDFSHLEIVEYVEVIDGFRVSYPYLVGPIYLNQEINDSMEIEVEYGSFNTSDVYANPIMKRYKACAFFEDVVYNLYGPMFENHSNITRNDLKCPISPGTAVLHKIDNPSQLRAPSKMKKGRLFMYASFTCGGRSCGGFGAEVVARVV